MSISFELIGVIGRHTTLFRLWYSLRRRYRDLMVTGDKEIVIEGYPRCANSFAVLAFEHAQQRPVTVAHHLHAEAQLLLGIRLGLPVLVLIREPVGAITSLVTRHPHTGVGQALRRYLDFYGLVERLREEVLVADFSEVTTDYGSVIERLNSRYATRFLPYRNSPATDGEIFGKIDELNRTRFEGAVNMVARPSEAKRRLLDARREAVLAHPRLEECARLYARLTGGGEGREGGSGRRSPAAGGGT